MSSFLKRIFGLVSNSEPESSRIVANIENTDELWEVVINNLPEEIKANVSAFAGKAYIHIKPNSKHLGVNIQRRSPEHMSMLRLLTAA